MQDPIISKIFEATQAAQEAEAQKDCDLTETQDVTGLGVITSKTPAQPTPITMPASCVTAPAPTTVTSAESISHAKLVK